MKNHDSAGQIPLLIEFPDGIELISHSIAWRTNQIPSVLILYLVGGIPTPLKNHGVRQLG
jgi:hypothetical protein